MSENSADPGTTPGEGEVDDSPVLGSRWPELGLALGLLIVAIVVIVDARRVGTGWDEFEGPRAGYFPFYVGCLLLGSSAWIAIRQMLSWRRQDAEFASRRQLASVWSMTWPMSVFVALVASVGVYLPSALLIAYFMRRHGRYGWTKVSAVALGVPLFFFLVFERWFLVALPKGPVEAWLGL
jgi:putative tricarboxylic transport membrane protein